MDVIIEKTLYAGGGNTVLLSVLIGEDSFKALKGKSLMAESLSTR